DAFSRGNSVTVIRGYAIAKPLCAHPFVSPVQVGLGTTNALPPFIHPTRYFARKGLTIFRPAKSLSFSVTTTQSFASATARPADVLALVVRRGMRLTLFGVAIGVVAALAVTRLAASLLGHV